VILEVHEAKVRVMPGFWRQLGILLHRAALQCWRANMQRSIFIGVVALAAVILGVMDTFVHRRAEWEIPPVLNTHTTCGLLTAVFSLGVFANHRPIFWRERNSGLSVSAFYLSKIVINTIDLGLQCFVYTGVYFVIRQPTYPFWLFFRPFPLIIFAASGQGYFISTFVNPRHGPFITALLSFISCGMLGHPVKVETMMNGGFLEVVLDLFSITRWSVPFYWLPYLDGGHTRLAAGDLEARASIAQLEDVYRQQSFLPETLGYVPTEIVFLLSMGLAWRGAGYLFLLRSGRCGRKA